MTTNIGPDFGMRTASFSAGSCVVLFDFANDLPFFKAYKAHSWEQRQISSLDRSSSTSLAAQGLT